MALYEHIYMVRQDVTVQQVETLSQQLKELVEGLGGTVSKVEYWGVKPLAYRIRKNRKAHFSLFNLDAPHSVVDELERQLQINEDVLRFLTVRVEEHEEGPSAMLRKRDDADKEEGGERTGRTDRRPAGSGYGRPDRAPRRPRDEAPAAE